MNYSSKPAVEVIVGQLKASNILDVVISPGSRNAPFIQSFTSKEEFNCYSVVDERSAGFFALGMALKKKQPVVLLCTSGSALLNYYPAIAEAFYQKVPLIVLSADRPEYCIDQGQGQTIRQNGVLDLHIRKHFKIDGEVKSTEELNTISQDLSQAFHAFQLNYHQPIHINVHLEEPLYDLVEEFDFQFKQTPYSKEEKQIDWSFYTKEWQLANKKLIVVGQQEPNAPLEEVLHKLSKRSDVLILTESTSNLNLELGIGCIDAFLEGISDLKSEFKPDLLIQFGGAIVSKKIKALLKNYKIDRVWSFQPDGIHPDIYFSITHKINTEVYPFLKLIEDTACGSINYQKQFQDAYQTVKEKREDFLSRIEYSDIHIYNKVLSVLNPKTIIHSANSSVIRYLQLFTHNTFTFYCNRGTSGIDGSTSTAVGYASQTEDPVCLITGDISFFYDTNALWNKYIPKHFKIILINNSGGDIFRIIPGAKDSAAREDYFSTTHNLRARGIASTFGLDYYFCEDQKGFEIELNKFNANDNPSILEIKIPEEVGPKSLRNFFNFIHN